jgi:thiol-disulfide isomerase/thioredoxin
MMLCYILRVSEGIQAREIQQFGSIVPNIELPLVSGGTRTLRSFFDGKRGGVVVFWSCVCSHCVRYDGYFNQFAEQHPELGLVAIAARYGENIEELCEAVADRKLTFPILHSADSSAAARFFAQQTPRAYLVDADLRLLYRGAIDNYKYPHDPEHQGYLEHAIGDFLAHRSIERVETASFGCAIQTVYYVIPKPLAKS